MEQHFIDPFLLTKEKEENLQNKVNEIALVLNGLYGYEIEYVIKQLRTQVFTQIKLSFSTEDLLK